MEAELPIGLRAMPNGSRGDLDVQGADVGQERRIFVAYVLEIKRPFHGREVAVLDAHATQH